MNIGVPRPGGRAEPVTLDHVRFPAVAITAAGFFYAPKTAADLVTCTTASLKRGHYRQLRLIDREGEAFVVTNARRVGVVRGGLRHLLLNPVLKVELQLESCETLALEQVQDEICAALTRLRTFWEASGTEVEALHSEVRQLRAMGEIVAWVSRTSPT